MTFRTTLFLYLLPNLVFKDVFFKFQQYTQQNVFSHNTCLGVCYDARLESVFEDPLISSIHTGLEGWRRAHCARLRRSNTNVQFPWYCKPGRISVIFVHVGSLGWVNTRNRFSYTGAVQRNANVHFITEQDRTGQVLAKFNGVRLSCQGFWSQKWKRCRIPAALRPWSGTIILQIIGSLMSPPDSACSADQCDVPKASHAELKKMSRKY